MAMTKAERARMAELEAALAAATVSLPQYDPPEPMTRDEIEAAKVAVNPKRGGHYERSRMVALGWGFNDHISFGSAGRVYPMWSDGFAHGRDNHTGDGGSQGMGMMFRTKREAAIALRLSLAKQFGTHLANIDRMIAEAKADA
jgi:hypothetical protein